MFHVTATQQMAFSLPLYIVTDLFSADIKLVPVCFEVNILLYEECLPLCCGFLDAGIISIQYFLACFSLYIFFLNFDIIE